MLWPYVMDAKSFFLSLEILLIKFGVYFGSLFCPCFLRDPFILFLYVGPSL